MITKFILWKKDACVSTTVIWEISLKEVWRSQSEQSLNYSWEQKKMFFRCLCKVSNDMRARLVEGFRRYIAETLLSQSKVQLLRYITPLTKLLPKNYYCIIILFSNASTKYVKMLGFFVWFLFLCGFFGGGGCCVSLLSILKFCVL